MADVEFFFDPVCPWAWITSRWVEEVHRQRPVDVEWRFIGLRIINEHRDYDGDFAKYLDGHTIGLRLLRVAAALREKVGLDAVGPYYTAVGAAIHVDGRRDEFLDPVAAVAPFLVELGHDPALADAALDTGWDDAIRADGAQALERTGGNVGTPILTITPPDGPSFFGPVISRIPRGDEAVQLWDSVERLARFPGFAELKRSIRERPVLER
ncbi:MAG: mycothiol-dependent nitroreductase Rv2466c family protein [Acidimicrobiales bacterium]